MTAYVEATTLNSLDFDINQTAIRCSRQQFCESIAKYKMYIKFKYFDLNLNFTAIHWESKLLPNVTGKTKVDILPIIVTVPNTEQLLEVSKLSAGTRFKVSSTIYNILEDWFLFQKFEVFVFDKTASNEWHLNGSCVLVEHKLGRNIPIIFTCRYHVFEIILQSVFFGSKFYPSFVLDIPLFKKFKNQWN